MSEKVKQTAERLAERKRMQIDEIDVLMAIVSKRKYEDKEETAKRDVLLKQLATQREKAVEELQEFVDVIKG